jgi:hypothetical protein
MEAKSKISEWMDSLSSWLEEQEWFQQLQAKWEELDPQSRLYLQFAGAGGGLVLLLIGMLSFYWSVRSTRDELMSKSELLSMLNSATDELRTLQASNSSLNAAAAGNEPWPAYFENMAGSFGITKDSIQVSEPKSGPSSDVTKETLFEITMKKINIHQAIRLAQGLEAGNRPVKLRNLTIDTQPDLSGYLDATLSVSAFALNKY